MVHLHVCEIPGLTDGAPCMGTIGRHCTAPSCGINATRIVVVQPLRDVLADALASGLHSNPRWLVARGLINGLSVWAHGVPCAGGNKSRVPSYLRQVDRGFTSLQLPYCLEQSFRNARGTHPIRPPHAGLVEAPDNRRTIPFAGEGWVGSLPSREKNETMPQCYSCADLYWSSASGKSNPPALNATIAFRLSGRPPSSPVLLSM